MLNPKEVGHQLGKTLRQKGYTGGIVTDWDDFWAFTDDLFKNTFKRYTRAVVSQVRGVDYDTLLSDLQRLNIQLYQKLGPNPSRWLTLTTELGKLHTGKAQKAITDGPNVDMFHTIYTTSPRLKPYTQITLSTLFYTGLPLILNSLAQDDWTYIKLKKTRTRQFFTHVETVDIHQTRKTTEDWLRAARNGNVQPPNSIAMGDSIHSDIDPASNANYKLLVWIPSHWGNSTSTDQQLPPNTIRVDKVKNLINHLQQI